MAARRASSMRSGVDRRDTVLRYGLLGQLHAGERLSRRNGGSSTASSRVETMRIDELPATREDRRWTTVWRSRAFVQPLLITIIGIGAPPAVLFAWSLAIRAASGTCTNCGGGGCGVGAAIVYGIMFVAAWFAIMLIAGFVVGRSSRDSRLALRAVLVAVASLPLTVVIVYTAFSSMSESLLDIVFAFFALAIVPLISVGLGFVVGRSVKNTPKSPGQRLE